MGLAFLVSFGHSCSYGNRGRNPRGREMWAKNGRWNGQEENGRTGGKGEGDGGEEELV